MRKYMIFRAQKREPGWEKRKLEHTQGLTRILTEHFDSSDRPIPEPGYRPTEFVAVSPGPSMFSGRSMFPGASSDQDTRKW